jgi:hypothetical protein
MKALVIAMIRVWLFTPTILDIPITNFNLPPIYATKTTTKQVSKRMFLYGYSASHWTLSTRYFQQKLIRGKQSQILGCIHMALGSLVMNRRTKVTVFPLHLN